jgi:hypothetical protein
MLSKIVAVVAAATLAQASSRHYFARAPACACSFHLTSSGHVSFPIGEDSEGEVLGGSKLSQASFCLNGDTITDSKGNPCFFTREWPVTPPSMHDPFAYLDQMLTDMVLSTDLRPAV